MDRTPLIIYKLDCPLLITLAIAVLRLGEDPLGGYAPLCYTAPTSVSPGSDFSGTHASATVRLSPWQHICTNRSITDISSAWRHPSGVSRGDCSAESRPGTHLDCIIDLDDARMAHG